MADESADECPICLDEMKVPYKLPCGHKLHYLCVKEAYEKHNQNCPLCRAPIPADVYDAAVLASEPKWDEYKWFYAGNNGGWWAYDDVEYQNQLEAGYQKYLTSRRALASLLKGDSDDDDSDAGDSDYDSDDPKSKTSSMSRRDISDAYDDEKRASHIEMTILDKKYLIDFKKMTQQQIGTRRVRKIKRDVDKDNEFVKGISGMRIADKPKST